MTEWKAPAAYEVGQHAIWWDVEIVCTRDHYAGDAAEHPWDPGDGWPVKKAATLWAPNGPDETKKLASLLSAREPDRLNEVLAEAVGQS